MPFLYWMLLPKPPSIDLLNALSTTMVFHTILLIKELASPVEKSDRRLMIIEPTGPTIFPPSWSSWPFEDTVQNYWVLRQGSPEGDICFESVFNMWYDFFHSQDESWVRKGHYLLIITPSNPLEKIFLPVSMTLNSDGLEVLVPRARVPWLGNTADILLLL